MMASVRPPFCDSVGLALFAVAGAQKSLAYGLDPVIAALLGMLTGIGGGIVADVLLANVPMVLRKEIYALAALAGAAVVVLGHVAGLPSVPVARSAAISFRRVVSVSASRRELANTRVERCAAIRSTMRSSTCGQIEVRCSAPDAGPDRSPVSSPMAPRSGTGTTTDSCTDTATNLIPYTTTNRTTKCSCANTLLSWRHRITPCQHKSRQGCHCHHAH